MRSIGDFIGEATEEFPDEIAGNRTGGGGFDGPPLDVTKEYRVEVWRAEWRKANTSGKWSFAVTFEVAEGDRQGYKFTEYYKIDKDAPDAAKRAFSDFLGKSGLNIGDLDQSDNDAFIKNFEGITYVIAPRVWGDEDDNTGIRYINKDVGQTPKEGIKPPNKKGTRTALSADINVNKDKGPAGEEPFPETTQSAVLPGTGTRPAGVNLPPGLGR